MIVGAYIQKDRLHPTLEALQVLKPPLRPDLFTAEEGKLRRADKISDRDRFETFLSANPQGYILYADACAFDVTPDFRGSFARVLVDASNDNFNPDGAALILAQFAGAGAAFCFAAEAEEYHHRNRYVREFPNQTVEIWAGRDLDRYLPGLYWMTSVEAGRALTAGLTTADAPVGATVTVSAGRWTMAMTEAPSQWRVFAPQLDDLCARHERIFSLARIRPMLDDMTTYSEVSRFLRDWR